MRQIVQDPDRSRPGHCNQLLFYISSTAPNPVMPAARACTRSLEDGPKTVRLFLSPATPVLCASGGPLPGLSPAKRHATGGCRLPRCCRLVLRLRVRSQVSAGRCPGRDFRRPRAGREVSGLASGRTAAGGSGPVEEPLQPPAAGDGRAQWAARPLPGQWERVRLGHDSVSTVAFKFQAHHLNWFSAPVRPQIRRAMAGHWQRRRSAGLSGDSG